MVSVSTVQLVTMTGLLLISLISAAFFVLVYQEVSRCHALKSS